MMPERYSNFADIISVFEIEESSLTLIFTNTFTQEQVAIRVQKNLFEKAYETRHVIKYDNIQKIEQETNENPYTG